MIHDQDLSMSLWAKESSTIVYVENRIPHHILGDKISKEAFIGEKLKVIHLRIFGCPIYIHVPKDKMMKMESSGKKAQLLAIVRLLRFIASMFLVRDISRSIKM